MDTSSQPESGRLNARKPLILERDDFPLSIQYGDTGYVLVLTRNDKLLLQKPLE